MNLTEYVAASSAFTMLAQTSSNLPADVGFIKGA
jgi:hypothetical protein